jgi:hypothetical protein
VGESNREEGILNNFGAQVVTDLYMQWLLSGFCFHMQTGTEDAPITTNVSLDDTRGIMVADNNSGVMVPLLCEVNVATFAAATNIEIMLEADMDKKRWSSGGTAFVPEQMNGAATDATAANGTFYTIEGSDIVVAAKSAVPASVELARKVLTEDALADPAGAMFAHDKLFSIMERIPVFGNTPSSLVVHFGASADITGYATLQFAQFDANLAW